VPATLIAHADEVIEMKMLFAAVHESGSGRFCCRNRGRERQLGFGAEMEPQLLVAP
jgi:hypothetical protein